jgi:predicted O-methyltransferase YrrM
MADLILIDRLGDEHPVKLFCKPGHYYSPLPDTTRFDEPGWRARVFPDQPREMPGIDWRGEAQLELLERFAGQTPLEFPTERPDPVREYWSRSRMYPALDAWVLQAFVRHLEPARVMDVGAGHSSLVTARVNRELMDGRIDFTTIDPFPPEALKDGVPGMTRLRIEEVQATPPDVFEALGENDLLFIDTSHVAKTGGDVPWIYNEILPRLQPGVVVHIHDIFMPGDYPEQWVLEGRAWNEQYLVQAFLAFNPAFEILFGNYWMRTNHWDRLQRVFPNLTDEHRDRGSSLWIRRRSPP